MYRWLRPVSLRTSGDEAGGGGEPKMLVLLNILTGDLTANRNTIYHPVDLWVNVGWIAGENILADDWLPRAEKQTWQAVRIDGARDFLICACHH